MFWLIIFSVMVFLCLLLAMLAFEVMDGNYFAISNSMFDGVSRFLYFRISESFSKFDVSTSFSAFFGMAIAFQGDFISLWMFLPIEKGGLARCNSAALCLALCFYKYIIAFSAITCKSIKTSFVWMKVRNRIDLLASCASFCLNCLRHGDLLNRLSCLEPQVSHKLILGSLYCITSNQQVNPFFRSK